MREQIIAETLILIESAVKGYRAFADSSSPGNPAPLASLLSDLGLATAQLTAVATSAEIEAARR